MTEQTEVRQFQRLASLILAAGGVREPTYLPPRGATYTVVAPGSEAAADAVIAAFDWDDEPALLAWEAARNPERRDLRDAAAAAVADAEAAAAANAAYLGVADGATAAQVRAQTKALTQQSSRVMQTLIRVVRRLVQID